MKKIVANLCCLLSGPLVQQVLRSVTNEYMDVVDTTNTLQSNPVLEPKNVIFSFALAKNMIQRGCESAFDKVLNQ